MKIIHVTESHEANAGGIPTVVDQLARNTVRSGINVEIVSVGEDPMPPPPGVTVANLPPRGIGRVWGWSPTLKAAIRRVAVRDLARILHIHGVWLASQWYAGRMAEKQDLPTLLSLHGQLEPYQWTKQGVFHFLKKKLYWKLMAAPAFRAVRVIHAVTPQEKRHLARFFDGQPIVVIPNAADLELVDRHMHSAGKVKRAPIVGFIGRFHPNKGIDLLVRAFEQAALPGEWLLALAGPPGDPAYMARLRDLSARSKVKARIRFMGPISGAAKWEFYRSVAVVAVPSHSEVMGMVNLEAAACGTPTITTFETGLLDWEEGGGLLVRPNTDELARALWKICSESTDEYLSRSTASRRLVEQRYCWAVVGPQWEALYASLAQ
jgi:glycosyltransferase involved in cell wall biosynthesis